MKEFLVVILLGWLIVCGFRYLMVAPDEDDVILELVKLGHVESTVVNGTVKDTLVNQKYRPLLMLWNGKGLSFTGNIISH